VVATGGFESDREWLTQHWGDAAANFKIRGCAYNNGRPIRELLDHGARAEGPPGIFHGTAVDRRSPDYDGGIVTRVDSIPLGIVVNAEAKRFYDEGEDIWPKRYAIWGRLIAEQAGQTAYSIFDSAARGRFIPPLYPPVRADTIGELARLLDLDERSLTTTVTAFNEAAAAHRNAGYDLTKLDGRGTVEVQPAKSNWALPIERSPFYAFPLRPGVTFTYYGVGVDSAARVATVDGDVFQNVFAAGEAMAGNILKRGYLAGVGMTIGTVFGRIAGEEAARHVRA
jgi:tricarballylate dehydrogenase